MVIFLLNQDGWLVCGYGIRLDSTRYAGNRSTAANVRAACRCPPRIARPKPLTVGQNSVKINSRGEPDTAQT